MLEAATILDATLLPAMIIALTAGLLSFLSPCVLPIVPPYLAYMGGVSMTDMEEEREARQRVIVSAAFFVHHKTRSRTSIWCYRTGPRNIHDLPPAPERH